MASPCDCCGELIYSRIPTQKTLDRDGLKQSSSPMNSRNLNDLTGLRTQCIIKNTLFRQIANKPSEKKRIFGASAGEGWFCKGCMEKKLGRKIKYSDLYICPSDHSIPFVNFSWIYKFFKEKEVPRERIISDLKRALSEDDCKGRYKYYKKEIEFYENT